eukprot:gene4512-7890_t
MKRSRSSFDIRTYVIEFGSVFYFKEIQEHFLEFLQTEFNPEPFLCVLAINELNELSLDEDIIQKCQDIVNKFINPKAQHEVNISQSTKKTLLTSLEQQLKENEWILEETAYEIFFPLKRILSSELNADNFPRFVRTKKFAEIAEKYSEDTRVMKVITALKYPFTDEYYEKPFITKSEVSFLNELTQDSFAWELIDSKDRFDVYTSHLNFLPESKFFSNAKAYKTNATLPYSFEKVANFFLSIEHTKQFNPIITDISIRETFSVKNISAQYPDDDIANQIHSIIGETCVQPPFPMNTPRKSTDVYLVDFDNESQSLTFIKRPFLGDHKGSVVDWKKKMKFDFTNKNKEKKTVDGFISSFMNMTKIEIIDGFTTRVTMLSSSFLSIFTIFFLVVDPKGFMQNTFVMDKGYKRIASQIEKTLSKTLNDMTMDVSLDSFKATNNEPFLNLAYKIMKKKQSFDTLPFFEHPHTDDDLNIPFIFNFEFDYFSVLTTDVHWDLIYSSNNSKIYYSNSNFVPNSKVFQNAKNLMLERVLDIPFEKLAYCHHLIRKRDSLELNTTKLEMLQKVNPEDVDEKYKSLLTENDNPSFVFSDDRYSTFPVKMARKIDYTQSLVMSPCGTKITGLIRPYIGDIRCVHKFNEKISFTVFDKSQQKDIEVEGYRSPVVEFSVLEKLSDTQTKISMLRMIDPRLSFTPGKTTMKMFLMVFAKSMLKRFDTLTSEIPNDFTFENANIDESKEPMVALLQELFAKHKQKQQDLKKE